MTIDEVIKDPETWQSIEVIVIYCSGAEEQFRLGFDAKGFYLVDLNNNVIRDTSELEGEFSRFSIRS